MNRFLTFLMLLPIVALTAQGIPSEMYYSPDGKILYTGGKSPDGMYEKDLIRNVYLDFSQPNYWSQLTDNYESETEIPATLTMDNITYDSVGVRFRGNTSYFMIGNSQKKSFAVSTDLFLEDQKIMGYKNFKFNNAHQDASFMREVLYCQMAARYTPIAKANYIHLYLNNQDWGIYPNIQAIDKTFLESYFLSNDGARFRATTEETGPGGGGPGWGDGTAGMNYLNADTATYKQYYELKSSDIDEPWQKLVDACQVLSTATVSNMESVRAKIDIDKALWFLAVENIFTDDDSYIMKGKMDYYVYYEPETDRTFPLEYDGNSSFQTNLASSSSWGPFKNVNNTNYPLLNKLLNIPEWRQRYLAHYRTILQETFTTANANTMIDSINAQIKDLVNSDTKKLYTYAQYTNGVTGLKTFVANRRTFLLSNTEVAQSAPSILSAPYFNQALEENTPPAADEPAYVQASVTSNNGINKVNLYFATGLVGNFSITQMYDDGAHQDAAADDGIFGGTIPGYAAGTLIRYYIEAIADNASLSASYLPAGAEHDIFVYTVTENLNANGIVINEILASNENGATDENGDHDDWIELYNTNDFEVDISGFYLSDDSDDPAKWQIPAGTLIPEGQYLILWADEELEQGPLHADFKISANGETIVFSDPALSLVDQVTFGTQTTDIAYARFPNGTGAFREQDPTFNASNNIEQVTTGIAINEILASNDSGATDEAGDLEDWVELYNNNNFDVDLSGFYLSDETSSVDKWTFPAGTIVQANGYLIIWADDEIAEGVLHASWTVSESGGAIILTDTSFNELDKVVFGPQSTDVGYARVPNGTGDFKSQEPTFNASNNIQPITSGVVVNEILASNDSGEVDEAGDLEDWVELYNNNDFAVDLSGFFMSDDTSSVDNWILPKGTIIPANGYLIVWADDEEAEGELHASWKISAEGEAVVLSDTLLRAIDRVVFGAQTPDMGYARVPNGIGEFVIQTPTFNKNNGNTTASETLRPHAYLVAYPNPFNDFLWVGSQEITGDQTYTIMDQAGRILLEENLQQIPTSFDFGHLAPGMYFLKASNTTSGYIKLIKL